MDHPVQIDGLSPQATRILAPDTPTPARMMAASGMAPLPPKELITVLYALSFNGDTSLGDKARATLAGLPDNILLETLSGPLQPGVLDGLAQLLIKKESAVERLVLNHATAAETVMYITKRIQSEKILEIICANEARLLGHPEIIEALYFNKHSRMSSVDRAMELAIRNGIELKGIPAFEEAKKALDGELIFEASDEPSPDDLMFQEAVQTAADPSIDDHKVEEALTAIDKDQHDEVDAETQDKVSTLSASLSNMTVSQKIRTAMLGSASQRSVLIRDANKLVIMSVLKSPGVNDSEVRRYSMLKSLPEEAVRFIANKREWTKQYSVKLNLVTNPRTPVEYSLRFMTHLRPNDLRTLERSKDIPGVIRNAAIELRRKRSK
ncbi:MAG: hypothetical protein JXX29_14390 [Deltaproteobacteria bacterium]|nr:hypothetical protein [Deltaproteobacteria bacterium]MBN2672868.1 hypothetical protein [Deltaproteobacteria bacterium]